MKNLILVAAAASSLALAGCTTEQGLLAGGLAGAAAGGAITHTVGGALVGAGIGALAGAVLVHHYNGYCSYKYHGKMFNDRCY